jgi:hypothetical protein
MILMRIRALLVGLCLAPAVALGQLANRPDSGGLATAIAKAIRPPLQRNGAPRSIVLPVGELGSVQKAWNPRLTRELLALDTALITRKPTKETMRVNISSLEMTRDSATVTVAMSRCNADRFVGASGVYVFKRRNSEWVVVSEQKGMSARGACPKAWGG